MTKTKIAAEGSAAISSTVSVTITSDYTRFNRKSKAKIFGNRGEF